MSVSLSLHAQTGESGWELKREDNGITVYSRNLDNSPFDEFKATTVVYNIPIDSVYALLCNDQRMAANDPNVRTTEVLQQVSPKEYYLRMVMHMPFFLKDRDVIYRVNQRTTSKGYIIEGQSIPDFIPAKEGIVRMGAGRTLTYLTQREDGGVEIIISGKIDLAGDAPERVVNKGVVDSTYDRLSYIRSQINSMFAGEAEH